jgi:hypothetical protein
VIRSGRAHEIGRGPTVIAHIDPEEHDPGGGGFAGGVAKQGEQRAGARDKYRHLGRVEDAV